MEMITVIGLLLLLSLGFAAFIFVFVNNKDKQEIDILDEVRNPL